MRLRRCNIQSLLQPAVTPVFTLMRQEREFSRSCQLGSGHGVRLMISVWRVAFRTAGSTFSLPHIGGGLAWHMGGMLGASTPSVNVIHFGLFTCTYSLQHWLGYTVCSIHMKCNKTKLISVWNVKATTMPLDIIGNLHLICFSAVPTWEDFFWHFALNSNLLNYFCSVQQFCIP